MTTATIQNQQTDTELAIADLQQQLAETALAALTDDRAAQHYDVLEQRLTALQAKQQRLRLAQAAQDRHDTEARAQAQADAVEAERQRVADLDATLTETLRTVETQMATLASTITAALAIEGEIGMSRHLQLRISEHVAGELFAGGVTVLGGFPRKPLIQKEVGQ